MKVRKEHLQLSNKPVRFGIGLTDCCERLELVSEPSQNMELLVNYVI